MDDESALDFLEFFGRRHSDRFRRSPMARDTTPVEWACENRDALQGFHRPNRAEMRSRRRARRSYVLVDRIAG